MFQLPLGFGAFKSPDMALSRLQLFLSIGFLIAAIGVQQNEAEDVGKSLNGTKDIIALLFPPKLSSIGAKASVPANGSSEALDDVTRAVSVQNSRDSSVGGKINFPSNETGDFNGNAGVNVPDNNEAPDKVIGKFNKHNVPGNRKGDSSDYVNGKEGNNGTRGEVSVKVPVVISESSDKKSGKVRKGIQESKPQPIDIEPYYIIDAPIREDGCKDGQRWSFGHCRDLLD